MKSILSKVLIGTFALSLTLLFNAKIVSAQGQPSQAIEGKTVIEVINEKENAGDFAQMLKESGYARVLKQQGPYTVLAPTNDALKAGKESMGKKAVSPKKLIQGHLYQGEVPADQIESQMDVTVNETDESAANGVVHYVDSVVKNQ